MTSRKQQQANLNANTNAWGRFVDLWRKTMPSYAKRAHKKAYAGGTKGSYL